MYSDVFCWMPSQLRRCECDLSNSPRWKSEMSCGFVQSWAVGVLSRMTEWHLDFLCCLKIMHTKLGITGLRVKDELADPVMA